LGVRGSRVKVIEAKVRFGGLAEVFILYSLGHVGFLLCILQIIRNGKTGM